MFGVGTVVNMLTVLVGGCLGLSLGARLPARISEITMQAVGGVTLLIGMQMAMAAQSGAQVMVVLLALVVGSVLGEWMDIEGHMNRLGKRLEARFSRQEAPADGEASASPREDSRFVRGFMTASLLFCVGPMAILGALQDGLNGDATLLLTKSTLDGIASVALAAALGPGAIASVLPIFVYQGGITLLAGAARSVLTPDVVTALTASGGIMIIGIGANLWKIAHIRVGNMLPGLALAGISAGLAAVWGWL